MESYSINEETEDLIKIKEEYQVKIEYNEFLEQSLDNQVKDELQFDTEQLDKLPTRILIIRLERCDYLINDKSTIFHCESSDNINHNKSLRPKKRRQTYDEKPFHCDQCQFKTRKNGNLRSHVLSMHSDNPLYNCIRCNYTTNIKRYFERHQIVHNGVKPLTCDECDYKTAYKSSLKRHKLIHSDKKQFACQRCDYKTHLKYNYNLHILKHRDEKLYSCDRCDFKTNYLRSMQKHENDNVCGWQSTYLDNPKYNCERCNFKTKYEDCLDTHNLIHSKVKRFSCSYEECNYKTNRSNYLKAHLLTHLEDVLYNCEFCNYQTNNKKHFQRHQLLTHKDYKPINCDRCNYKTNDKNNLTKHLKIHLDKIYKCDQCDYSTNCKRYLVIHQKKIHNKLNLFSCDRCTYTTNYIQHLKKHITTNEHYKYDLIINTSEDILKDNYKHDNIEEDKEIIFIDDDDEHIQIKEEKELTIDYDYFVSC